MRCILFRHGIAVEWHDWKGDDRTRPLTEEGIEKTKKVAKGLLQLDVHPTQLLCSPFTRTQQTAKIAQDILGISDDAQLCQELLSEASPEHFVKFLASFSRDDTVLCVGHEPHLGFTAGVMVCGQPISGMSLKKAGACSIYFEGTPRAGTGFLEWWLPPAHLRKFGKE
ncbi:MAG: histidine phosphatase family protein [Nitrospirae bacterium]|nr:histidine phosphatase family protein [Nitrospirota bacterium]MDA1305325.1 histidine phosphatase family protein [Nitrospirota bacterium]